MVVSACRDLPYHRVRPLDRDDRDCRFPPARPGPAVCKARAVAQGHGPLDAVRPGDHADLGPAHLFFGSPHVPLQRILSVQDGGLIGRDHLQLYDSPQGGPVGCLPGGGQGGRGHLPSPLGFGGGGWVVYRVLLNGEGLVPISETIQSIGFMTDLRESALVFPIMLTTHLSCIAVFGGMILMTALRLLGLAMTGRSVTDVVGQFRIWKRVGFCIMVTMGGMLAGSEAVKYSANPFFWGKMTLLVLMGVHALVFR